MGNTVILICTIYNINYIIYPDKMLRNHFITYCTLDMNVIVFKNGYIYLNINIMDQSRIIPKLSVLLNRRKQ